MTRRDQAIEMLAALAEPGEQSIGLVVSDPPLIRVRAGGGEWLISCDFARRMGAILAPEWGAEDLTVRALLALTEVERRAA